MPPDEFTRARLGEAPAPASLPLAEVHPSPQDPRFCVRAHTTGIATRARPNLESTWSEKHDELAWPTFTSGLFGRNLRSEPKGVVGEFGPMCVPADGAP